jgi:hypothetical protein
MLHAGLGAETARELLAQGPVGLHRSHERIARTLPGPSSGTSPRAA